MAGTLFFLNKLGSIFLKYFNVTFTANSLTEIKFEGLNVTFHDKAHLVKRCYTSGSGGRWRRQKMGDGERDGERP
jgi:hypothetical protein